MNLWEEGTSHHSFGDYYSLKNFPDLSMATTILKGANLAMNNFAKGASLASLVFSVGIGIGLFFLRRYHEEKVGQAKIEGIEDFINSGSAAKYANSEPLTGEYSLGKMNGEWEVIVRSTTPGNDCN